MSPLALKGRGFNPRPSLWMAILAFGLLYPLKASYMKPALRIVVTATVGFFLFPLLLAQNAAKVYVYSPWESPQHSKLTISYDGVSVAEVQPGRFLVINAQPGRHVLIAGDGVPTVVEVKAGEESFVRLGRHIEISQSGQSDIPVVETQSPDQARHEIANLVYVSAAKIFSDSVSKQDPSVQQLPKLKNHNPN